MEHLMADSINPHGNNSKSSDFLPRVYRSDANKKFLQATVDQLVQPGTVKKVNGYIGRQNAKATTGSDIFVSAPDANRQNYQLEPALTIKDAIGNTTFFKDYQDYINQISAFGGNITNHARINEQEFYSWDPHICWDKFVNFQNYYWLPFGPDPIRIIGQAEKIESTFDVTIESQLDSNAYIFSPAGSLGLVRNPTIKLYKGQTYKFNINSPGNPFSIKRLRTPGTLDRYQDVGLSASSVEHGVITFTVPYSSPDVLYYVSEFDADLGGVFEILSIEENTKINVSEEILGKKTYKLSNGTELSNGMKVYFSGKVTPEEYADGFYYVEGVGTSIELVNERILEIISQYSITESVLFDATPFDDLPFSESTSYAGKPDYIVINRSSKDRSPWSRYNRWFHKNVIEDSAIVNGKVPDIDQSLRAVRPIIEFEPNLKLFNFGTSAITDVDLVDTFTTDVFSNIEGQLGYNVDGVQLAHGHRVLFTADTDKLVKNKVYRVEFLTLDGVRQIHLVEETLPLLNNVVLVRQGQVSQGEMYWYNGSTWNLAQQKTTLNQSPLFDVVDSTGVSYGDTDKYDGSTFIGTKLFSYKVGNGTTDSNLGFALSYKNINNIGDIVFNFNLLSDSFLYKDVNTVFTLSINTGFLIKTETSGIQYVNGWQAAKTTTVQAAVRIYKNTNKVNYFDVDVYDDVRDLDDLVVRVYINGIRLESNNWELVSGLSYKTVVLKTDIALSDVLTIRSFAKQPINSNGYYEIPINLQNNPLNDQLIEFTLGEVIDHVNSIVDNLPGFVGVFPGANNIRDLGDVTPYGTKFVQHSGPIGMSLYHMTSEDNNIIRAIEKARDEYNQFKRNFVTMSETIGIDADPVVMVDLILEKINKDKPKTHPYYLSDMVPYGAKVKSILKVVDPRIKHYPLTTTFNLEELSTRAVGIYLNGTQLLHEHDYTFDSQGFVVITELVTLAEDDEISVYEYDNTNGSFVPPTPTKLGIWPSYDPKIYIDTTYLTPRTMIQGHDGSLVLSYGDYRDDIILELEKRIYNNIKVKYDINIFDIHDIVPSYSRITSYSLDEFNEVLAPSFYKWTSLIDKDFAKPLSYDRSNSLTYNYGGHSAPNGENTPGYWRGIYRWMFDTDRPNLCPWEMLGFFDEPTWWSEQYGVAPYTSDNLPMWQDIANGVVREPGKPLVILEKYRRSFLIDHIPVDAQGNVKSPYLAGLAQGIITAATTGDFVFGDCAPIENTWRRSSFYPFSVLIAAMILQPAKTFGTLLDRSRIKKSIANQLIYAETGLRITPASLLLPSIYSSTDNVQTAGIINYIVDYILSDNLKSYEAYNYDLLNLSAKLSYRIGGFTSKEKLNLILDSKTPTSQGSIFVPQEDYDIILNSSSPVKKITYSGVIVTKLSDGFEVKGYSKSQPYFKYYSWISAGVSINVGGISESYSTWAPYVQYAAGKIVMYNNKYYRTLSLHTTKNTFESNRYQILAELPIIGGRSALMRTMWNREDPTVVPYGTKFDSIQEVVDFLLGYGEWLKDQGFIFDEFNNELNSVTNWETSSKEFLFWTTQNWSTGEDKWDEWTPNTLTAYGSIVRYNGDYYRAIRNSEPSEVFNEDDFVKLDGLSTVGSSVISLSPSAAKLTFKAPLSVVDDIRNPFNTYEIFKVDGTSIAPNFLNSYRDDNSVSYIPQGSDGIYGATFYLVQKEQVVVLNNTTIFNDTLYSPTSGYRQERIKISGYVNTNWNGSFNIPGFVFDQAVVQEWELWKDYALGDIVKYKEFYYSAKSFLVGTEKFNATDWVKLDKKPTPQLLPNWSYKATQFTDFYSLDSDNFDLDQQMVAQHLVGYQPRRYLSNIIQDNVSEFKFYQGMIVEKGTHNVLNKLFDVLSADNKESLTFHEEWALRVGSYGAAQTFENIEFVLDEAGFKNNPQGFELVDVVDTTKADFIYRQTPNDIYLKPLGYNNNPWPLGPTLPILRSPGYVRSSDVKVSLKTLDDVVDEDVTTFVEGDYVWVSFEKDEWNVYRYTNTNLNVTNVTYENEELTISCEDNIEISEGSYIGINQVTGFSGFYKVDSVIMNKLVIKTPGLTVPDPFVEQQRILVFVLTSQRVKNVKDTQGNILDYAIDRFDTVFTETIKDNELVWIDDNGNNKWVTMQYSPVFSRSEITNPSPEISTENGRKVLLSGSSNTSLVSNNLGKINVYYKAGQNTDWYQMQLIDPPFISNSTQPGPTTLGSLTGDVLAVSTNGRWLATGTPQANSVCTPVEWINSSTYMIGTVVLHNGLYYRAIAAVPLNTPPVISSLYWDLVEYVPVDRAGENSLLIEQGVISLYEKDANNTFTLVDTIISPAAQDAEYFGASIVFGNDIMLVSAPGYNNNAGRVYRYAYTTEVQTSSTFNPTGSTGTTIKVGSTVGIKPGMVVVGEGFNNKQKVDAIIDSTTIRVNVKPDRQPSGVLQFTTATWRYKGALTTTGIASYSLFGKSMSISADNTVLSVSVVIDSNIAVVMYDTSTFTIIGSPISSTDSSFGSSVAVSYDGSYVAISTPSYDNGNIINQGKISIYEKTNAGYVLSQEITSRTPEVAQKFGSKIFFMGQTNSLVVYSSNADNHELLQLLDGTTFDDGSTRFMSTYSDAGCIDVYDRYFSKWVYSETLKNESENKDNFGESIAVSNTQILVSAPNATVSGSFTNAGRIYEYIKPLNTYSWSAIRSEVAQPNISKIKKAFLYNKLTNKLVSYIDVIDSNKGKIPGIADQEIKYKTFYDPATYSVGSVDVNVDDGMAWSTAQIGMLWWDLRSAKFVNSYDSDIVYRNSTWNTLAIGASIDVYEWIESEYLPSEWDALADTEEGLTLGISGISLYSDTAYSIVRRYDNISKTFKNKYYYWVNNKKTTPAVQNRYMSAQDVANLIENPRGAGYRYLALTASNSFSLVNVKPVLEDTNVILSVEYWTSDNIVQNIHSQWKLISNSETSEIPTEIEEKWFNSLCGKDAADRIVPDYSLPIKLRYGVENRPRQSMFVNRFEALKQLIEQVNRVLIKNLIVEQRNVSSLNSYEVEPSVVSSKYDTAIDTDAELRLVTPIPFVRATIVPIITNGRITGATVVERGRGYLNSSYVEISGSGVGAKIKTIIDNNGRVTGVTIIEQGQGYDENNTTLTIRSYCVLVKSDSAASGKWSIYSYEKSTRTWSRIESQSYDTRNYWSYVDWYATGYNQFTATDYAVDTFADLTSIEVEVGQIVKIRTTQSNTWVLLERYAISSDIDWTRSYKVVGSQNGTIQFSSSLYQFAGTVYGYDGSLYDTAIFDNSASAELRIILNCIKNNIFIDDLKPSYLDLFFTSVRYALSEQNYLDWIFKTSFVKAQHNVGELKQKVTYNNDNLSNFEDYVNEVKPYRTKIREYVSSYNKVDNASTAVTDFDLPPVYDGNRLIPITARIVNGKPEVDNPEILTYPWKHWLDNVGFSVIELKIHSSGSGYTSEPIVRFVSDSGTGATARAFITNGKVNRVVLLTQGSGYLSAPTVIIDGGLSDGGTPARVIATIGNGVVRSDKVTMKYDRITYSYFLSQIQETETFTGSGSKLQFALRWAPDVVNTFINNVKAGIPTVLVDNVEILKTDYKLTIVKSTSRGYTSYSGLITFESAPAKDKSIVVNYTKDWSLLNAADRIQYYYNPAVGLPGKDLEQLMTGIDYGGVIVNGMGFDTGYGWNNAPYYSDKWDSADSAFDDYIVNVAANTHSFILPYIPESGTEINVYHVKKNVDIHQSTGSETTYTYNPEDVSPVATAVVNTTAPTSTVNVAGSTVLRVASTAGIKAGDVVSTYSATGNISATSATGNVITLSSTAGLFVNEQIKIKGATIGNLSAGTYYIKTISGNNITISAIAMGATLTQVNATGAMAFSAHNVFALDTKVVQIVNATDVKLDQILYAAIGEDAAVTFTRELVVPTDCVIYTNGTIKLNQPLDAGTFLNISSLLPPKRIDDENYGTVDQSNPDAVMETWIGDSISKTIIIPGTVVVSDNDQFILRKSTSEGAVLPQDSDYDTSLSGGKDIDGFLGYQSATGLAADDIIVDGDGFVTPTTSPAPEEVVPGQVVDAVAIKVFDRPYSASANIKVDHYTSDGTTTDFAISQRPNSSQAVVVKFTDGSIDLVTGDHISNSEIQTLGTDYTVDYRNQKVKFTSAPPAGKMVSIFSFGFNGSNILDIDYFIGDGIVSEFITQAPWTENAKALIYLDGVPQESNGPILFKTGNMYDMANRIGIRFSTIPDAGSLINYVIVDSIEQSYAVTKTERIPATGVDTYNLSYKVGNVEPIESSMIVRVGQTILNAANTSYYTIKGNTATYNVEQAKFLPYSVSVEDITVIAGGDILISGVDYTVALSGISVKINQRIRREYAGETLVISIATGQQYTYLPASGATPPRIKLNQIYNTPTIIEVISSYNHDILDIQRTAINITSAITLTPNTLEYYTYNNIAGGLILLDRAVLSDEYVWVIKNGTLLTPGIDYKLNDNKVSILLESLPAAEDQITLMTFSSNVLQSGIAYMQFKDMLNRVHFKRLSLKKQTTLAKDLTYNDLTIEVNDATNFDVPNTSMNRPGVVEICGERIEYFSLNGNILGQLRRGTLGTGVRSLYKVGTVVQDIGPSETIPYVDTVLVENIVSDGTADVSLTFAPMKAENDLGYIPTTPTDWIEDGLITEISNEYIQADDIEVFANGIRLKKKPSYVYSPSVYPESPEGDVSVEAEFVVDGVTSQVTLTAPVEFGTQVTVVKRSGRDWDGKTTASVLDDTTSKISRFIKAEPGIWYIGSEKLNASVSFDSTTATFDSTGTTFDQG